jgi:hypothetical protein
MELHPMTDLPGPTDESRYSEALIEKVAEAIRFIPSRPAMDDPNLDYWGRYWRALARAALATIEAEQQAEVAALVEAAKAVLADVDLIVATYTTREDASPVVETLRVAMEPFERTLGSTQ